MKKRNHCVQTVAILAIAASLCRGAETNPPPYQIDPNYKPTRDLSQFFAKVKAGRPVTVMSLGGSVTEGHSWCAFATEWLQKEYPNHQIRYVDGALGGRGPDLTAFRFRREHLPQHPDLVFIEYVVNSYPPKPENYKALDGMVQQLLRQWQKPDIVFVYVNAKGGPSVLPKATPGGSPRPWAWWTGTNDVAALEKVQPLARYYGFQEVDVRTYAQGQFDDGKLTWDEFARDPIHPTQRGHAIYAEPVIELLKQQAALADHPTPVPPVPAAYGSDEWTTATVLPISAAHFGPEWKVVAPLPQVAPFMDELLETDQTGAVVTVTARTTTFGVYRVATDDGGRVAWSIDGGKEAEFNLSTHGTNGNVWFDNRIFQSGLPPGEHTLTLRVCPKVEPLRGTMVRIGGFCVTNPKP